MCTLSIRGRWLKFLWSIPETLKQSAKVFFPKSPFVAEIQGFKVLISARKIFAVAEKRREPAEKFSYRSIKKANMSKAKRLIEKGVPATSTCCPVHLSRQFLSTAYTSPCSSKNYSAEHIHAFFMHVPVCVIVCNLCVCLCVCVCLCK